MLFYCHPGGAFWNLFGSMQELELPLFVLVNVLTKAIAPTMPELFEDLKKKVLSRGIKFYKESKGANAPKPAPSYKPTVLGSVDLDSRGHLP